MPSVREQYADFMVNVKLNKKDDKIVQVISPPDVPEGETLTQAQADIQAMLGCLVRLVNSKPHTNYFLNAKRDLIKDFLRHVPKALHKDICWQVTKVNEAGQVTDASGFVNLADIEEYADLVNKPYYIQSLIKPTRKVEPKNVEVVNHEFGWDNAVSETKKQKA